MKKQVTPMLEHSLLEETNCEAACHKWLQQDVSTLCNQFDLDDMPYLTYFLQQQTQKDIQEWAKKSGIVYQTTDKKKDNYIAFERLASLYNTTIAGSLSQPEGRFTQEQDGYQQINTPTAQNGNFWQAFYAQQSDESWTNRVPLSPKVIAYLNQDYIDSKDQQDSAISDSTTETTSTNDGDQEMTPLLVASSKSNDEYNPQQSEQDIHGHTHTGMSEVEEKFLFLRCMQQASQHVSTTKNPIEPIQNLQDAQTFYQTHSEKTQTLLPILSALSDMPVLRNHVRSTTQDPDGKTLLTLDRSAAYGSEKHDDSETAKKLMQSMLCKWRSENNSPDAEFLFLTVVQADSFERRIASNNTLALQSIQKDCQRWQTLHENAQNKQLSEEEKAAITQEIHELKTSYGDFADCLNIQPEKIYYANVRQRGFISPFLNWIWDTIVNPINQRIMAFFYPLPTYHDAETLSPILLEKLDKQIQLAQEELRKNSNNPGNCEKKLTDLICKKGIFTDLLLNASDPAHKTAALIVLASLCGVHVNITCKSGKDRTGCISALASSLRTVLDQEENLIQPDRSFGTAFLTQWNRHFSHPKTLDVQAQLSGQNSCCARGIKSWTSILDFDSKKNPGLDQDGTLQKNLAYATVLANNNRYTFPKPKNYQAWLAKTTVDEPLSVASYKKNSQESQTQKKPTLNNPHYPVVHSHLHKRHEDRHHSKTRSCSHLSNQTQKESKKRV